MFVAESFMVGYQITQGVSVDPAKIKCPKLVISCKQDVMAPESMEQKLAEFLQADYISYWQFSHLPMLEAGWEESAEEHQPVAAKKMSLKKHLNRKEKIMKLTDNIYTYEWTNYFDNNCNSYYIGGEVNALIDPGLSHHFPDLLNRMSADGIKRENIRYVINTHSHPDHLQASELFDPESVQIALHCKELDFLKGIGGELYGLFGMAVPQMQINLPPGGK